jgi:chemotaxis protein methyltransferase CheR
MTLTASAFDWVCATVRDDAAIVLGAGKEYLVESRLAPLARAAGRPDVVSYIEEVRIGANRTARDRLVEALTTNETSWFRDGGPFTALENEIVPQLRRDRAAVKTVNVWSAACSTGQEPYSVAMILHDTLGAQGWQCGITATDLSPSVIAQAQRGTYSQVEMNRGLPASMLAPHFRREAMRWVVNENLRRMITFKQLNLARPFPPIGQFDIIFLRNVLIYFSVDTRREVLRRARAVCKPDGYLVLGGAETTLGVDDSWTRTVMGTTSVYRPLPTPRGTSRPDRGSLDLPMSCCSDTT